MEKQDQFEIKNNYERAHWADKIAEELIKLFPNKKEFICAAGITPSGKVHIGNFRDIITSELVCRALADKGYKAELIFSWDDFDRLRKIPEGIPLDFSQYLGMPLTEVPDPYGCHNSYAKHFESEFEEVMPQLGVKARFIYQSEMYQKNKYYEEIKTALSKRKIIAKILGKFRTQGISEKEIEEYYPLQIYCRKCRKSTTTRIINYDGENKIEYSCECGHRETADISKENIGKLGWKIDWAMRWKYENVSFEPGGTDHAAQGGSYYAAKEIAKEVFSTQCPLFKGYVFIGIQGAEKMSSSKGTGIVPKDLLKIYEPELLRWMFCKTNPDKSFTLFFDTFIIKQYEEFDRTIAEYYKKKLSPVGEREIEFSGVVHKEQPTKERAPFRQIASFGQITQGNFEELKNIYKRLEETYDEKLLRVRLEKSQNWINKFMPELKIKLREIPNRDYYSSLTQEERNQINKMAESLSDYWSLEKLTWLVYEIPKNASFSDEEKKKAQRIFFKNVYQMLIDADTGPRLATFLIAIGKDKVEELLNIGANSSQGRCFFNSQ